RREVPDRIHAPLVRVVRRPLEDLPGCAAVVAAVHVRAPDGVGRRGPGGPPVARVDPGVVDLPALEQWRREGPARAVLTRVRDEQPALGADHEDDVAWHAAGS